MNSIVTLTNDTPMTTSLKVAEVFEKEHKTVLRSIKTIQSTLESLGKSRLNFVPSTHMARGKEYPMYQMDRDAFSVLVFGFTGEKAIAFRADFIKAFNEMELELMKAKANLLDTSDVPYALETLAAALRAAEPVKKKERLFPMTEEPVTVPAKHKGPLFPSADETENTKAPRNFNTASVRNTLPKLGLRPQMVTRHLVKQGFLIKSANPWANGYTVKYPTTKGKPFFVLKGSSALHVTEEGVQFLLNLKDKDILPENCLIKEIA